MGLNQTRIAQRRINFELFHGVHTRDPEHEQRLVESVAKVYMGEGDAVCCALTRARARIEYLRRVADFQAWFQEAFHTGFMTRGGDA